MADKNEVRKDNPAGRLYHILAAAQDRRGDKTVARVWYEVFDINPPSVPVLFDYLRELQKLVAETKTQLEQVEEASGLNFLKSFDQIETVVHVSNLDGPWQRYKERLNPQSDAMTRLELGAQALSGRRTEQIIDEDELSQLKGEIESLSEKIIRSDSLNDDLKAFIMEKLEGIRRAIQVYRLRGITNLRKAFEESLGGIIVNRAEFERAKETEEVGWFKRILSKAWSMITFARLKEGVQLANEVKELLGP